MLSEKSSRVEEEEEEEEDDEEEEEEENFCRICIVSRGRGARRPHFTGAMPVFWSSVRVPASSTSMHRDRCEEECNMHRPSKSIRHLNLQNRRAQACARKLHHSRQA